MKTIQILRTLINIVYYILIGILILGCIFLFLVLFFPELLPTLLGNYAMLFSAMFSWKMYLAPLSNVINYVLLIIAMFFLKKSIPFFLQSDFYSEKVISNLKKAGNIFIFIGISSIVIQFFAVLYIQNLASNMIHMKTNFLMRISGFVAATIDLKSITSIIIGLFFLLFSKIFENSRILKQENDLTI